MASRKTPKITFDQYKLILKTKADVSAGRGRIIRLSKELNLAQSTVSTAICRGIRQYDYRIWKESGEYPRELKIRG